VVGGVLGFLFLVPILGFLFWRHKEDRAWRRFFFKLTNFSRLTPKLVKRLPKELQPLLDHKQSGWKKEEDNLYTKAIKQGKGRGHGGEKEEGKGAMGKGERG
jgi:hypothetical protein